MTSPNGGTYVGQYLCVGWIHNLEVTLLMFVLLPIFLFFIQGDNLKKTIDYSRHKHVLKGK